jgi:hypothetical protein
MDNHTHPHTGSQLASQQQEKRERETDRDEGQELKKALRERYHQPDDQAGFNGRSAF